MKKRYKIKFRSTRHDSIPATGWYIYSRRFPRYKSGQPGFRRYRMAGPFPNRSDATVRAGVMAIKFDEFATKLRAAKNGKKKT